MMTYILCDMAMFVCLMIFFGGFCHVIIRKQAEYEWVGTLALVAGALWCAVSLVAGGLAGGALLDTIGATSDPSTAIIAADALPKWVAWFAWTSALLCVAGIPAMYVASIDHHAFYNAAG